jgi:hypothetical protein
MPGALCVRGGCSGRPPLVAARAFSRAPRMAACSMAARRRGHCWGQWCKYGWKTFDCELS